MSRTTADNVRIIRICSDNMQMTCKYANNMWTMSRWNMQRKPSTQIISQIIYMILKWNYATSLWQIPFNNPFLSQWKDSLNLQLPWEVPQMMCQHPSHLQMTCRWPADDVRMMSGWCMSSATQNLQQSLTLVSSAHRPHIVRASSTRDFSSQTIQVKHQRTALLKMKALSLISYYIIYFFLHFYLYIVKKILEVFL